MKACKKSLLIFISVSALLLLIIISYKVNAEPKDTPREYIPEEVAEESSEASVTEVTEPMPAITEEYIAEVLKSERPYSPINAVSDYGYISNQGISESVPEELVECESVRYALTEDERAEIERVVMAEAGTESREGIIAVAQCILNAAEKEGIRPTEAVLEYKYTPDRKDPNEAVIEAVSAVFDYGETVTDEQILYFYAVYKYSGWHETKRFVMQIGVHRFFTEKEIETK